MTECSSLTRVAVGSGSTATSSSASEGLYINWVDVEVFLDYMATAVLPGGVYAGQPLQARAAVAMQVVTTLEFMYGQGILINFPFPAPSPLTYEKIIQLFDIMVRAQYAANNVSTIPGNTPTATTGTATFQAPLNTSTSVLTGNRGWWNLYTPSGVFTHDHYPTVSAVYYSCLRRNPEAMIMLNAWSTSPPSGIAPTAQPVGLEHKLLPTTDQWPASLASGTASTGGGFCNLDRWMHEMIWANQLFSRGGCLSLSGGRSNFWGELIGIALLHQILHDQFNASMASAGGTYAGYVCSRLEWPSNPAAPNIAPQLIAMFETWRNRGARTSSTSNPLGWQDGSPWWETTGAGGVPQGWLGSANGYTENDAYKGWHHPDSFGPYGNPVTNLAALEAECVAEWNDPPIGNGATGYIPAGFNPSVPTVLLEMGQDWDASLHQLARAVQTMAMIRGYTVRAQESQIILDRLFDWSGQICTNYPNVYGPGTPSGVTQAEWDSVRGAAEWYGTQNHTEGIEPCDPSRDDLNAPSADALLTAALALVRSGLYPNNLLGIQQSGVAGATGSPATLAVGYVNALATLYQPHNVGGNGAGWLNADPLTGDAARGISPTFSQADFDFSMLEGTMNAVAALVLLDQLGSATSGCANGTGLYNGSVPDPGLETFFGIFGNFSQLPNTSQWPQWPQVMPWVPG